MAESSEVQPRGCLQIQAGDFVLEKLVGEGAFGRVYLGKHKATGGYAAVKVAKEDRCPRKTEVQAAMIAREAGVLRALHHKNVVAIYRGGDLRSSNMLAMEYILGVDLSRFLSSPRPFTEEEASQVIKAILSGLSHIHQRGYVHRDLKPSNILLPLNRDFSSLKLVDFGLALSIVGSEAPLEPGGHCGTPMYMSPERLEGKSYSGKADLFAVGVMLLEFITGKKNPSNYFDNKVAMCDYFLKYHWHNHADKRLMSPLAQHLFEKLTERDVDHRYSAEEALRHPWVTRRMNDMVPFTPKDLEESIKAKRTLKGVLKGLLVTAYLHKHSSLGSKFMGSQSRISPMMLSIPEKPISFVLSKKIPARMKASTHGSHSSHNSAHNRANQESQHAGGSQTPSDNSSSFKASGSLNQAEQGVGQATMSKFSMQSNPQSHSRLQVRSIQYQASRPLRASLNWKDQTPGKQSQNLQNQMKLSPGGNESLCGDSIGEDVATNDTNGKPQASSIRKDSNPSSFFRIERELTKNLTGPDWSEDGKQPLEEGSVETNQERYSTPAGWTKSKMVVNRDWKDNNSPVFSPASLAESLKVTYKQQKQYPTSHKASLVQVAQAPEGGTLSMKQYQQSAVSVPRNLDIKSITSRGLRFAAKNGEYFAANGSKIANGLNNGNSASTTNTGVHGTFNHHATQTNEVRVVPRSHTWATIPMLQPENPKIQIQLKPVPSRAREQNPLSVNADKQPSARGRYPDVPIGSISSGARSSRAGQRITQSVIINANRLISPDNSDLKRLKATPTKKLLLADDHIISPLSKSSQQTVQGINLPTISLRNPFSSPAPRK